jgi:anthranilate phosphoribosyltransferase
MIRECIAKLADGQKLTRDEAFNSMLEIMSGEATPAQISAYITALRIRGETADIIAGSAAAMREKYTPVIAPTEIVVDTCGTGGDASLTFNISTAAAFVAAGAGVVVAKHGNRGVTSRCGSADVLTALGVNIEVSPALMGNCLTRWGIAFLFAPLLHPAMKYAIGPRREIGIRTIFNILGPLSNPAGARYGVLGVYHRDMVPVLADAAAKLGAVRLFVVHGLEGLDELSTIGPSRVAEVRDGMVTTYQVQPEDFGLKRARPEDLKGGDPETNAQIIRAILNGEQGPKRDIVLLNAAAAIVAGGRARDMQEGLRMAARSVDSGMARQKLDQLILATRVTPPSS